MKVYVSSTYQDLVEHRAAVDRTLRRMGHDVIGMEQYVAEGNKPLERCLNDVKSSDVYVVIVAWRYGFIPLDQDTPGGVSITELEYRHAVACGKTVLPFLLDPEAPWPPSRVDAMGAAHQQGSAVAGFRSVLGTDHLTGMFRTPDDLASQVAAAVSAQGLNRFMVDRVLTQTSVQAGDMGAFGEGTPLDSTIGEIKKMVAGAGSTRAIVIDLGVGDRWWSTRLFLLSSLLQSLTGVKQLVFRNAQGRFAGMASPSAVLERLASLFPLCRAFVDELRTTEASADTERELDRQLAAWRIVHDPPAGPGENLAKVGVRAELLDRWLGERLVTRCIQVDQAMGLTMAQVQQIVDSLVPDVPVERPNAADKRDLQVVDRDAFALELAKEWVRAGIPRNPVR